jgi:putative cell wall-binding protein
VFPQAGAFRKVSLPVKAISPAGGASTPNEVTFQWEDYLATNYPFNGTAAGRVTQEAASYQVQVSTTAEFTNIIETSPMLDQTRYTAQTVTYPEGPLYWRVRAFDQTGNPLTYSCGPVANGPQKACSDYAFTKSSPTPTLVLPAPGAHVPNAPTMTWSPMAYAKTYEVEIYRGTSVDPSVKVASLATSSTSVIGKTPLAAGTYGWRARSVDARGLPGRWTSESALRTFVVAGNPVTLRLPANGSKVSDIRVLLQWDPVPGAARYKAEASLDAGFGTLLDSVTTDQPAWAPGMSSPKWPSGKVYWRVTALDANNAPLSVSGVWSFVKGTAAMTITRYAGSDRFGTAVQVSKATFPAAGVPVVYVATGGNFADALAGGPAAYKQGGPVLLVAQNAIPSVVAGELSRLKPARIVILGGTGAVSAAVASKLDAYTTGPIVRLAGANRFDTAGKVALYAFGKSTKAYIANGTNYPDALAGAVAAAKNGVPLLLVTTTDLPAPTRSAMTSLGVTSSTVLGGTGVVSPAVMTAAKGNVRLAGTNRYSTAVAISKATFATANAVFLATGSNFPDALSGTPSAAKQSAPLLLANGGCLTADTVAEIKRLGASKVYVLGGTGAVPESAARLATC